MRVAYVCTDPGVPVFGHKGCSVHVQEVLRSLLRQDVDVELFTIRAGGDAPADLQAIPVHLLPPIPKGSASSREQCALETNEHLLEALAASEPFDFIYERHSLWSYAGLEYAKENGIPGLLEVNAPLLQEQLAYRRLAHPQEAEHAVTRAFAAASAQLCVSDAVAEYVRNHPAANDRIHVVPNGVDPDRIAPHIHPTLPAESDVFTVGFVGTLKPWHGVDILVATFAELYRDDPRTRLLIVGDGPQRDELEADVQARDLAEAVLFVGAVEPNQIPAILTSMDVAVAPYPALANFYFSPLKILEYMAAGRAIIASGIGQINSLIDDEVTGLLCTPGDTSELAAALQRLKADRSLGSRLGDAARREVVANHTWDGVGCRILKIAQIQGVGETIQPKA